MAWVELVETEEDSAAAVSGEVGYKVQGGPGKVVGHGGAVGNVAAVEVVVAGEMRLEVQ